MTACSARGCVNTCSVCSAFPSDPALGYHPNRDRPRRLCSRYTNANSPNPTHMQKLTNASKFTELPRNPVSKDAQTRRQTHQRAKPLLMRSISTQLQEEDVHTTRAAPDRPAAAPQLHPPQAPPAAALPPTQTKISGPAPKASPHEPRHAPRPTPAPPATAARQPQPPAAAESFPCP
jgi:hypothetical protein